ncbi:cyclase family protein [Lentibacillus sp. N15]|uniref:cyclase family protein n=1 Tax=Lentibacillus songyuanensis TaxID=3136161 RepID=UPI0031BAE3F3
MPHIIDLSMPIESNSFDPKFLKADQIKHGPGGNKIWRALHFPKKAPLWKKVINLRKFYKNRKIFNKDSFPDSMFLSDEILTLSVHCGTHLDAPFHYGPQCEGKPSKYIHEIPLDWCFSDGVVLDLTSKQAGSVITKKDLQAALKLIDYEIKPMDIVLIRTDYDKLWPQKSYFTDHPGMSKDATKWLLDQGVKVIGIDTNGFDLPFMHMVTRFMNSRNQEDLWPCHMLGRKSEYVHIERLAGLDQLKVPFGFKIACFPVAVKNAGASWIRAVAIIN